MEKSTVLTWPRKKCSVTSTGAICHIAKFKPQIIRFEKFVLFYLYVIFFLLTYDHR